MEMQNISPWVFYAVLLLAVILFSYKLHAIMTDEKNPIEWWQFLSSKASDGTLYADITKLGQVVGIVLSAWVVIALSARVTTFDLVGFCGVLALALSYLAGVQAFQAYLKSKGDK